jgi:hypothetical protein
MLIASTAISPPSLPSDHSLPLLLHRHCQDSSTFLSTLLHQSPPTVSATASLASINNRLSNLLSPLATSRSSPCIYSSYSKRQRRLGNVALMSLAFGVFG